MFLPFSSNISLQIFRNRKFSILRISCSRSGRFYFRLRTDQACAEQPELQDFCGRDLMSPESFWHCPADQKAWRLWVLEWHQVHNIWSKKKERAEKKRGKWKLAACENRRRRPCLIFTLSRTYLVFSNWKQLIMKPYICLPQRLTRHENELTTVL